MEYHIPQATLESQDMYMFGQLMSALFFFLIFNEIKAEVEKKKLLGNEL